MDQQGDHTVLTLQIPSKALGVAVAATLALAAPVTAQQPAPDSAAAAGRADTAHLTPAPDQARGVGAELETALFELAQGNSLAALDRLEWLRSSPASQDEGALPARGRADLLFLLSQAYYRLGMAQQFHSTAQELQSAADPRYTGIVDAELMLDAYRRGDYALAQSLLAASQSGEDRGLVALVGGLAAYRAGDFAGARAAFATARGAGGAYAPYAQYMDAMALLAGDTARTAQAVSALESLAQVATGVFGDQVRLAAAQLALAGGNYEAAVTDAAGVRGGSGLEGEALLVKAWALYRTGKLDDARAAFQDVAARYPVLPERDQARVMAGQAMLEAGHTADAERYFDVVADSVGGEAAVLASQSRGSYSGAAQALVAQRAAGVLFLEDPRFGRTLALPDAALAAAPAITAAYAGQPAPPAPMGPTIVSLGDISTRVDSTRAALGSDFPGRVLFRGVSAPDAGLSYATRAAALESAESAVALARFRLRQQQDARALGIGALETFQRMIADSRATLDAKAAVVAQVRDSLARMAGVLDASRTRVRQALTSQLGLTREMAQRNVAMLDSMRNALAPYMDSTEARLMDTEIATAKVYQEMSGQVEAGLDAAIGHHPVFALRDSIQLRLSRAQALHDSAMAMLAENDRMVSGELARRQSTESARARALRVILEAAEAERATAERQLVTVVENELRARAQDAAAALERDREAAEYGSASAAFFRAMGASAGPAPGAAQAAPNTGGARGAPPRR